MRRPVGGVKLATALGRAAGQSHLSAATPARHLLADRPPTISGAPARDYVHEEDGWILATRAVYAGDTLHQLIVIGGLRHSGASAGPLGP